MNNKMLFNNDWQFALTQTGADAPQKELWQPVEIPHDWLIWDAKNLYKDGDGWYKKSFNADTALQNGRRLYLYFDGVYFNTTVWLNGKEAFNWKYGYSSFYFDCTDFLQNGENELILRANFQAPNSRWYSGAGIYRNVWLIECPQTHIVPNGVYISIKKQQSAWHMQVDTELCGKQSSLDIVHRLYAPSGELVQEFKGGQAQTAVVKNPLLWDIKTPNVYTLQTSLVLNGKEEQQVSNPVGFRTVEFKTESGFWLNGKNIKIFGACQHHDLGALGAAFNADAARRQLEKLGQMGVNAIRTAHNMPAPELMQLCDEMGFLVCSEAFDMWQHGKTEYDYARFFDDWAAKDVESWVKRDRNHPSLIMWSIGNEIGDTNTEGKGLELTKMLAEFVAQHDPHQNALVTLGSNYMYNPHTQECADAIKLAGYNYLERLYDEHHEKYPDWLIYGSETGSVVQSRGIYHFPLKQSLLADDDEQCSALGNSVTSWGAKSAEACALIDFKFPFSAGQFIWSGTDYIGEPTPYHTRNSYFGQIDTAGFEKDSFYVYKSAWTNYKEEPFVHIFPYWDFSPGQQINVRVCSNAPQVELFFNGKSLGRQALGIKLEKLIADYDLAYKQGTLTAHAFDENGEKVAECERKSFKNTASLVAVADKGEINADGKSLAFIEVQAVDEDGNPVANASDRIEVSVSGAARLAGIDNGDSADMDEYKGTSKRLFSGRMLIIVAATHEAGDISVKMSAAGLPDKEVKLKALETQKEEGASQTLFSCKKSSVKAAGEVPVRKIELICEGGFELGRQNQSVKIKAKLLPENASYSQLEWTVTNAAGVPVNIAALTVNGNETVLNAIGDGEAYVRCMSKNGSEKVRLISQLCFNISGLGTPFISPYELVSGMLYTKGSKELTNGNERGISTPREQKSFVSFEKLDFGSFGSNTITLPVFAFEKEPFQFEIWQGIPNEADSALLLNATYSQGSTWNTYLPETYTLPKRLKGVQTVSFVFDRKIHLKGFAFEKQEKNFAKLYAAENDVLYGDNFEQINACVEKIGNNVTLGFNSFDFAEKQPQTLEICGRTPLAKNAIRLVLTPKDEGEEQLVKMLEFDKAEEYTAQSFKLEGIKAEEYDVEFIFLPGSNFDFKYFRFS